MLGGLIAGALKGGAEATEQVADVNIKKNAELDLRKQLLEAQELMELRVDEVKRERGFRDEKRKIEEIEPLKLQSDIKRTQQIGAAETGVQVEREDKLRPGKIETTKQTTLAAGDADRANLAAYANDPDARKGVRAKAQDSKVWGPQESLAQFQLDQARSLQNLRVQLSQTTDAAERETLTQRIRDLQGLNVKSMSDVATMGDAYRKMADNLRRDANEGYYTEDEKKGILNRAQTYEKLADQIFREAVNQRLPGGATPQRSGAPFKPQQERPSLDSFFLTPPKK